MEKACTCRCKKCFITEALAAGLSARHETDPRLTTCKQQLGSLPWGVKVRPAMTQKGHQCRRERAAIWSIPQAGGGKCQATAVRTKVLCRSTVSRPRVGHNKTNPAQTTDVVQSKRGVWHVKHVLLLDLPLPDLAQTVPLLSLQTQ